MYFTRLICFQATGMQIGQFVYTFEICPSASYVKTFTVPGLTAFFWSTLKLAAIFNSTSSEGLKLHYFLSYSAPPGHTGIPKIKKI